MPAALLILLSLFDRVRSFDFGVRRRGELSESQSSDSGHSLTGLCDSLVQWLSALFTLVSPLSISVEPSVVLSVFDSTFPVTAKSAS